MISDWRVRVDHFVDLKKYAKCEFTRDKLVPIQPKTSQHLPNIRQHFGKILPGFVSAPFRRGPEVHLSSAGKADDPPSADHGLLEIAALMVTAGLTPDAT